MLKTEVKKIILQDAEGNDVTFYLKFNMESLHYLQAKYNIKIFKTLQDMDKNQSIDEMFILRCFESMVRTMPSGSALGTEIYTMVEFNPLLFIVENSNLIMECIMGAMPKAKGKKK